MSAEVGHYLIPKVWKQKQGHGKWRRGPNPRTWLSEGSKTEKGDRSHQQGDVSEEPSIPTPLFGRIKSRVLLFKCFTCVQPGHCQRDCLHMDCTWMKMLHGTQVGTRMQALIGIIYNASIPDWEEGGSPSRHWVWADLIEKCKGGMDSRDPVY